MITHLNINDYKIRHEHVLRNIIDNTPIPAPLIKDGMIYTLFPGGKRLRPLLVYLCGELTNVPIETSDIMAAAIEMIHAYSLTHDDLPAMDNDDLRRGQPTCHRAFDEATAILVGDGLQALAIDTLLQHLPALLPISQVVAVAHELLQACGPSGMVSGQSLDLSLLQNTSVAEPTLQMIHHLKTGQLIVACINMVIAAGAPTVQEADALRAFANHLGLLFQMQDDYLDRYAQNDLLGKGRSSDAANQKQTFASLYSQALLSELINEHIIKAQTCLSLFSDRGEALQALLNIIKNRI